MKPLISSTHITGHYPGYVYCVNCCYTDLGYEILFPHSFSKCSRQKHPDNLYSHALIMLLKVVKCLS